MDCVGTKIKEVVSLFWFGVNGDIVESKLMYNRKNKKTTIYHFEDSKRLFVENKTKLITDISYECELTRKRLIDSNILHLQDLNNMLVDKIDKNNVKIEGLKKLLEENKNE